ncbi:6,7-dimethyl-8-ribityllumazine synthase [Martelella mediterranea]|uniref:6,7-dimethyl-8-ribityllumazine synthase n=1 Tax=Martelella mediterranea TaxID=293089 RepID=A0A4R3NUM3_9HYPH|nr:6,7-dimethyl-8-ribityllumazine synthase [Martelella mediterranea]TCT41057.1 6,7-dimethyl-8-ribityllumazine synthase [Martelella mediterranea]
MSHRIAIVISRFNEKVTSGLLNGAKAELAERGHPVADADIFDVPGAFETPVVAKKLAETGKFAGVVCIGAVIKGDTAHFEYISEATAHGLMQVSLETGIPVSFGILTTYTAEQAFIRSAEDRHNKGREAAAACVEALAALSKVASA